MGFLPRFPFASTADGTPRILGNIFASISDRFPVLLGAVVLRTGALLYEDVDAGGIVARALARRISCRRL